MTQEELKWLIIDWFSHIEQLATDRKNLNGYVMDYQNCIDEIKMIAKNSKEFVEQYFEVL